MKISEIRLEDMNPKEFIDRKVREISSAVGNGLAVNALSGGVDSSAVAILGSRALGSRLKNYFIENGLMREGEADNVVSFFKEMGVEVEVVDAKKQFFSALKGISDPEQKREAITQTFYRNVFGDIVKKSGAKHLLHGTILTDVEETVAGVKRQHNILSQLGIDPEKTYGYSIIEPLVELRKPAVRELAKMLGLPKEIYARPPFPGPALAARIIGEVNEERVAIARKATSIVENEFSGIQAFQCLAILHADKVTGVREGKREFGFQIEVRCWDSKDAVTGSPTKIPHDILTSLAEKITYEIPEVVSVTYNITKKPPSTIEAV